MTLPFCQLRILVAENDGATQRLMAGTLEKMGMVVVLANNGQDALDRFAADHFELVFLDLAMPGMDGLALAAAIRRHESAFGDDQHVPIIAMAVFAQSREREQCLAAGVDSYIERPSSSYQIQSALLAFSNPESLQAIRPPPKWTRVRALARVGGDESLLAELITIFSREKSRLLGQMDRALLECRPELLQQSAHDLQDQLNYLGASEVSETARRLAVTASQPTFSQTSEEMTALLRSQLFDTELAMSES